MKKIVVFLMVIVLMFSLISCGDNTEQITVENEDYARVNGEIITTSELDYFKKRDRADVINEYAQKYNVTDFSDFWDTKYDGKTPAEVLEQTAFDDAVEAKIRLVEMRKRKIYTDISFEALQRLAKNYNNAHTNQKASVGVNSIDLTSFYTYYIQTGEMELKNILAEDESFKPTQEEIDLYLSEKSQSTQENAISVLVSEKYEKYIENKISSAKIERL